MPQPKDSPSRPSNFVTKIDVAVADKLIGDLVEQGFEISKPAHTLFSAKKKGVSCTLYESGKLMVQGKGKDEFIEFYLEPQVLKSFGYSYQGLGQVHDQDTTPHIGIDESGKGDLFGPLCVGGVFAGGDDIAKLRTLGVRDSKGMSDKAVRALAAKIRQQFAWHVVRIGPAKYNELYSKFGNLNHLLAWGHATTIETLIDRTGCNDALIDQFANERVVLTALRRKNVKVNLTQRHRGEEDIVVAAASILARDAFLYGIDKLSEKYGITLPKGAAAQTIKAGRLFVAKHGREALVNVCKMHFKTVKEVER